MKSTSKQRVKTGIFTLVSIGVLAAGIFVIGNKRNLFGGTYDVYGTFRNISGLQMGNLVRFNGINVGTVEGINIVNDSTISVYMKLKMKVRPFIKQDATASIGSDGLMGDKLISIAPGVGSAPLIADGGTIRTANPVEFDKIIARISLVADHAEVITSGLASIANQVSAGKGSIGKLIFTDSLERGLVSTIRTANATVKSVNSAVNSIHEVVDTAKATMTTAKKGVEGFKQSMDAVKHNVLLRGYFKKKDKATKKAQRQQMRAEKKLQNSAPAVKDSL
jgi:phospholipid/cholesterol/gamma-HCH transport system substrate-binding protein